MDAVRALVKNRGMIEAFELLKEWLLRLFFAREKTEKRKRHRGQPAHHRRHEHGGCAGQHTIGQIVFDACGDQYLARVGYAGHARVRHIDDRFTRLNPRDHFLRALAFVFAIATHQLLLDADMVEERQRPSCVLTVDRVAGCQRLAYARGEVAEIADWGCAK
ncbi:hypothetical protein SDC9_135327 [bioreactor metagenome]|uniref:Uncharacterized protein n=1 Tax=bioreactor metagenome TaxID=1076179 RepID=A0A645DFV4_9ZZZZ